MRILGDGLFINTIGGQSTGLPANVTLSWPLRSNLNLERGAGTPTFTRSSTGTAVKSSLLSSYAIDAARFEDNGYLSETASTNLIWPSNDFTHGNWGKSAPVTLTPNYGVSPDGTTNSTRVQFTASAQLLSTSQAGITGTVSSGTWVKGVATETIQIAVGGVDQLFVLDGTWQFLKNENKTAISAEFNINTFGGATARDIEIYEAQVEAQSFTSSTTPTTTTAVTRAKDVLTYPLQVGEFNETEGTIEFDFSTRDPDGTRFLISISDGTSANRLAVSVSSSNTIQAVSVVASATAGFAQTGVISNLEQLKKVVVTYKSNQLRIYIDGVQEAEDLTVNLPTGLDTVHVGARETQANQLNGHIKNILFRNEVVAP